MDGAEEDDDEEMEEEPRPLHRNVRAGSRHDVQATKFDQVLQAHCLGLD